MAKYKPKHTQSKPQGPGSQVPGRLERVRELYSLNRAYDGGGRVKAAAQTAGDLFLAPVKHKIAVRKLGRAAAVTIAVQTQEAPAKPFDYTANHKAYKANPEKNRLLNPTEQRWIQIGRAFDSNSTAENGFPAIIAMAGEALQATNRTSPLTIQALNALHLAWVRDKRGDPQYMAHALGRPQGDNLPRFTHELGRMVEAMPRAEAAAILADTEAQVLHVGPESAQSYIDHLTILRGQKRNNAIDVVGIDEAIEANRQGLDPQMRAEAYADALDLLYGPPEPANA